MQEKRKPRRKPLLVKEGLVVVKIYHTKPAGRAALWQVADRTGGKRVLRSFTDKQAAVTEAERIARALSSGQTEAALMGSKEAASYGRAIELLRPTGDSLELASARYAAAVKILGSGANLEKACAEFVARANQTDKTVAEVVAELIAEKESGNGNGKGKRSRRTIEELRSRLGIFARAFQVPIASVTKGQVQAWLDGLQTSEQDKAHKRQKVHQLFEWAWRRDYILENPVKKVEKPDVEAGDVEIYTAEEIARLLNAASKEFRPFIAIGAFAGLRVSEIQRLEWSQVNLAEGHIALRGRKRGSARRIVPIQPNLAAWLADYAKCKGMVWGRANEETCDEEKRCAAATATHELSALKWKQNALRHSFCSNRLAVLKSDSATALEAGNSADVIHKRYKELVTERQAKAYFAIAPERPGNVTAVPAVQSQAAAVK